ncbi:receptor-like protein 49 [Salvia hispanica]|uniref:receptor-like protein 49 n=1 Tax=Salvia hispanica TaxID=49212 RepID=UPI0020091159|nr:receptor-like protein 49 [Salvia hispanica]
MESTANVRHLDLSSNRIGREIPGLEKHHYLHSSHLFSYSALLLANNRLSGAILTSFCSASSFSVLDLSFNNWSETFDVSNNNLTGKLPKSLGNCKSLALLNVRNDDFEGSFPCMLPLSLRILVLRSNRFHGDLRCSKSWPNLQILDISLNNFSGNVEPLNFSSWSGGIPDAIGNLSSLYLLNLSRNVFTGGIPESLGGLTELGSLDLSSNKLTGRIPHELTELGFLSILNVSYNDLTGMIPIGRQFQTLSADLFEGNAGLCGFPLDRSCSRPPRGPSEPEDDSMPSESKVGEIE